MANFEKKGKKSNCAFLPQETEIICSYWSPPLLKGWWTGNRLGRGLIFSSHLDNDPQASIVSVFKTQYLGHIANKLLEVLGQPCESTPLQAPHFDLPVMQQSKKTMTKQQVEVARGLVHDILLHTVSEPASDPLVKASLDADAPTQ